jgi:hypothetical protein
MVHNRNKKRHLAQPGAKRRSCRHHLIYKMGALQIEQYPLQTESFMQTILKRKCNQAMFKKTENRLLCLRKGSAR